MPQPVEIAPLYSQVWPKTKTQRFPRMAEIDSSSLSVLLQDLSHGLPDQIASLFDDEQLRTEILHFLNEISTIESKDYLSSVPPTPASGNFKQEERTLVQDIAELEAQQRSIDSKLKSLVVENQGAIVETKKQLTQAESLFEGEFQSIFKSIWRTFNENELEDVKEPQDLELQELEADLEPEAKDTSFHSVVLNVKKLVEADGEHNTNLSIVLENMEQVINILELPSLTGACIKAGYYSESLEISSYTRRLAIRFPHSDLIREVETGIKLEMSHMLTGLIRLLRTNLKQSSILKILSYLRRIPPFSQVPDSDSQLKRILLHARYQFIKLELDSLRPLQEGGLNENYLKRSIEVIREHGFGSIMTFKNVFPDADETEMGPVDIIAEEQSPAVLDIENEEQHTEQELIEEDTLDVDEQAQNGEAEESIASVEREDANDEAKEQANQEPEVLDAEAIEEVPAPSSPSKEPSNLLLFEFVTHILNELLRALESSLPQIQEKSTRDGLYLQLIYCAHSLGRIDVNFSDLMTAMLLNARAGELLLDRAAWAQTVEKQKQLTQSLLK